MSFCSLKAVTEAEWLFSCTHFLTFPRSQALMRESSPQEKRRFSRGANLTMRTQESCLPTVVVLWSVRLRLRSVTFTCVSERYGEVVGAGREGPLVGGPLQAEDGLGVQVVDLVERGQFLRGVAREEPLHVEDLDH